jgi:dolichol-phosphate mannosyltransferase
MEKMKPTFSIIVPVFNEEEVLEELYRRTSRVMDQVGEAWELILVDDGSRDRSAEILGELHERDHRVKGVSFSRNFGFQEAATAGLTFAGASPGRNLVQEVYGQGLLSFDPSHHQHRYSPGHRRL